MGPGRKEVIDLNIKPEEIAAKCVAYFDDGNGFACSESILLGFQDVLDLEENIIPQIGTAFGGGVCGQGLICGALQASFMILGLKYGRKKPSEDRTVLYEKGRHLMDRFRKQYGTLNCKGIRVIPEFINDPEKVAKMKSVYHETVCKELVGNVAIWLLEELDIDRQGRRALSTDAVGRK